MCFGSETLSLSVKNNKKKGLFLFVLGYNVGVMRLFTRHTVFRVHVRQRNFIFVAVK